MSMFNWSKFICDKEGQMYLFFVFFLLLFFLLWLRLGKASKKKKKDGKFHLLFLQKVCQFKNLMESKDGRNKKSSEIDSVLRKYEKQGEKNGIFHLFFSLKGLLSI